MTIEEAKKLKLDVEDAIVDALNKLEQVTGCKVTSITLTDEITEGEFDSKPIIVGRHVDVNLEIK